MIQAHCLIQKVCIVTLPEGKGHGKVRGEAPPLLEILHTDPLTSTWRFRIRTSPALAPTPRYPAFVLLLIYCSSFLSNPFFLLLPIVFFFFRYLILLSSFSPLLRGAALLSIFIMRPGKKADRNRAERNHFTLHNRHSLQSCFLISAAFYSASYSSIFNSFKLFSKRFHFSPSVIFDPLYLSVSTSILVFLLSCSLSHLPPFVLSSYC